jgi:hypothetical protein
MIRLTPKETDDTAQMPAGFEAERDLTDGRTYVDAATGDLLSAEELTARLKTRGKRVTRVVRVTLSYRLTTDPEDNPRLRQRVVAIPVIGDMSAEELGRVVHMATRKLHEAIAGQRPHRKALPDDR